MNALRRARECARDKVMLAIKEEARRQLAVEGAARLSLRAIARQLGVVSSALYRYFPSRDDLLTALIIDAYNELGAAAERAFLSSQRHPAAERWVAVCQEVRTWALAHPHEYALLYGSPVPDYTAPQDTNEPASRIGRVLVAVARDAHAAGALAEPPTSALPGELHRDIKRLAAELAPDLPEPVVAGLASAWAQLFGLVSFEVFGHYANTILARDEFFGHSFAALASQIGL